MTAHPTAGQARPTTPRLAMVAVVLAVADSPATWWWLQTGVAVEGNPWLAGVLGLAGPTLGLALRTVWVGALVGALVVLARRTPLARAGLWVAVGGGALALGWHAVGALWLA